MNRTSLDNYKIRETLRLAERNGDEKLAEWCRKQLEGRTGK